jgi:predicted lipoprotein with Yx(FWY)xxD motif
MQQITVLCLASLLIGTGAQAMTVREGDIAGKTDLVAVADNSVNGTKETILTDSSGFSLYTFTMDSSGVSKCTGGCLTEWPPQHVPTGATVTAPFGTIKGNDGQTQLTLNGLPLYHYADDKSPGDAFGEYPNWDVILVTN